MNASPARRHGSDAGIVVPMTLIIMALITAMTVAVLAFTSTEPFIASAGTIDISGNITMNGLIYAQNDVSLRGAGAGSITGAVISTNRVDAASTNVDTDDIGNAPITYNCPSVRSGGGTIPQNWFVKPGTYKEVSGT